MSSRRDFLKQGLLGGASLITLSKAIGQINLTHANETEETAFSLPSLPYAYNALEPFIDEATMKLHHTKHHQAYIDKLNAALKSENVSGISIEDICKNVSKYSAIVRNNGGGHYNHSLFWKCMKPNKGTVLSPTSSNELPEKIKASILSAFDSFENFKIKFSDTALKVFGSGWAWLVMTKDGKLEIGSTPNQDNPLMDISKFKGQPLLGLDVWEHAYYLKYQNKRVEYVSNWWNIVNWTEVEQRLLNIK